MTDNLSWHADAIRDLVETDLSYKEIGDKYGRDLLPHDMLMSRWTKAINPIKKRLPVWCATRGLGHPSSLGMKSTIKRIGARDIPKGVMK